MDKTLFSVTGVLRDAVVEWREFDKDQTVNGGDLVDWFGPWRERAKEALGQAKIEDRAQRAIAAREKKERQACYVRDQRAHRELQRDYQRAIRALSMTRNALLDWVEIAEEHDQRRSDYQALEEAAVVLELR